MFSIRNRNWANALYYVTRHFANVAPISLKGDYPALFQLVHPRSQPEVEKGECDVNTVLSWKCPNKEDHEWTMSIREAIRIYDRNVKHNICPFCSGSRFCYTNSLAFRSPDVARELMGDTDGNPVEYVTYGSKRKLVWKCRHDPTHIFTQAVNRRTDLHMECPYCSLRSVSPSNCLKTRYPELASEFDRERNAPLSPETLLPSSSRRVWWKCKDHHHWQGSVHLRVRGMCRCEVCGANDLISLKSVCPELASWWDYDRNMERSPTSVSVGSQLNVFWICSHCHGSFQLSVSDSYKRFIQSKECLCNKCVHSIVWLKQRTIDSLATPCLL